MYYDIDANIISIELSKDPIEQARDFGNFIIHISPKGRPVLLEILEADKFARQFDREKVGKQLKKALLAN
jgi:hypothetical protein